MQRIVYDVLNDLLTTSFLSVLSTRPVVIMKLLLIPFLLGAFTVPVSASSTKRFIRSAVQAVDKSETPPNGHVSDRRQLKSPLGSGPFPYWLPHGESKPENVPAAVRPVGVTDAGEDRQLTEAQSQVTKLQLINADTDQVIVDLEDTMVIALDAIPGMTDPSFNILALVSGADIRSVRYGYNGNPSYRTETVAPYAFCGNDKSNYYSCDKLGVGTHTVTVTPRNRNGKSGRSVTVTFTIVESDVTPPKLLKLVALTPTTVNVTAKDAFIVLQATVQDDASGWDFDGYGVRRGMGLLSDFYYLYDPNSSPVIPRPSIGTQNNDIITHNITMRIRKFMAPGVFPLFYSVTDKMINTEFNDAAALKAKGFVYNITVINSIVDTTKPSILAFAATSPLTVDATTKSAVINFTVTVQDDLSGIDFGSIEATFSNDTEYFSSYIEFGKGGTNLPPGSLVNNDPELPAGVPHTFKVSLPIEKGSMPPGQYDLTVTVLDGVKNTTVFDATKLAALGYPSKITVV
jgi:hypothetical protein